jgi:hypothetical protein
MVYDVRVKNPGGRESQFEYTCDEPLAEDGLFTLFTMIYKVLRILPDESDRFDAVVEVDKIGGPGRVHSGGRA